MIEHSKNNKKQYRKKLGLFLVPLFLIACQTTSEQEENTRLDQQTTHAPEYMESSEFVHQLPAEANNNQSVNTLEYIEPTKITPTVLTPLVSKKTVILPVLTPLVSEQSIQVLEPMTVTEYIAQLPRDVNNNKNSRVFGSIEANETILPELVPQLSQQTIKILEPIRITEIMTSTPIITEIIIPDALQKMPIPPAKTDYIQARPPMSEQTKQRLKAEAQALISNGRMPQIKYQQAVAPQFSTENKTQSNNTKTPKASNAPLELEFNSEQVEIRHILEDFADDLNITMFIDPSVSGAITVRVSPDSGLTQKDRWPLLQMLMHEAGVTLEKGNGVYYAKKSTDFIPSVIGTKSILGTTDASLVMQVTSLKNISLSVAETVLRPMIGPKGRMVPIPSLNTLLIVNTPENLQRINGLLSLIDTDPFKNRGIHLYKIKEAEAKVVAKELKDILILIEGNKPAYQVMGLERINALLVVAPPGRGFRSVTRWVDILDSGADEELIEQIFIYKCKSMTASSLAATLNAVFQQDDKTPEKKEKEENDNPYEFKTVSRNDLSVENTAKKAIERNKKITAPKSRSKLKSSRDSTEEVSSANINVTIVADEETNSLLVRTTARDYKQLLETIRTLDTVPLQVLVNVVIAQVRLSDSQSFGIDWAYFGSSGTLLQTNFGQAQSVGADGNPLGLIVNRVTSDWRVTVNALAQDSDVNILSRPSLLITNNEEGVINVGKEVPVETSNTTNTNSTDVEGTNVTQQIAYRKTGIELTVTPHINEDGIVNMKISQGLSAIEGQTTGSDAGLNPTFTNQEIDTTVIVKSGETIILGGLIESVEAEGESGIPVLKDVPIMGALFKSQGSEMERRELILVISTNILNIDDDYDEFNALFSQRYRAAAQYIDKEISYQNKTENLQSF